MKAAFVAPIFYRGTSFERICTSIELCINKEKLDIDYICIAEAQNDLNPSEFDNKLFFKHQLDLLERLMQDSSVYDKLLFIDFFNPGIDLLKYYLDSINRDTKIYSLLHGGTFYEDDLLQSNWLHDYEKAWTSVCERVYVPSRFAYSQLPDYLANKAKAFHWGLDSVRPALKPNDAKDIDVVFPHRISADKGINDLLEICKLCPEFNFVITSPSGIIPKEYRQIHDIENLTIQTCVDNEAYYATIGRAKVVLSCAYQELYGYSIAESVLSGAIPVLPKRQAYPEYYENEYMYKTNSEAAKLIRKGIDTTHSTETSSRISSHSFRPILKDFLSS